MIVNARPPSQWKKLACPIMSVIYENGSVTRVNCMAGDCALWEWLSEPWPDVPNYFCDGDPARLAFQREGVGSCSLPEAMGPKRGKVAA